MKISTLKSLSNTFNPLKKYKIDLKIILTKHTKVYEIIQKTVKEIKEIEI